MRQRVPVNAMRIDSPEREAWAATLFAVAYIAAALATGFLVQWRPLPILGAGEFTQDLWYAGLFKGVLLLALPLLALRSAGYGFADVSPGWRGGWAGAAVLVTAFLAGNLLNLRHLGPIREALARHTEGEAVLRLGLGLLLPLLTAAIPEELVYRGILQTRLERVLGRAGAILLSVALFTAWHLPTRLLLAHGSEGQAGDVGSVLLRTGAPVALVGFVFALAWDRFRNLPALVAVHWGVDLLPCVRSLLGDRF